MAGMMPTTAASRTFRGNSCHDIGYSHIGLIMALSRQFTGLTFGPSHFTRPGRRTGRKA
jgi:hypothetical protein